MNKRQVFMKMLDEIDVAVAKATDTEAGAIVDKILDGYTIEYVG